jgi:hypothetical protein
MTPLSDESYKRIAHELDPLKAPTRSRKTPRPPRAEPIDNLKPLTEAGIPIIHVVGDKDTTVPVSENTAIAEKRYKEMGRVFEVIHKNDVVFS